MCYSRIDGMSVAGNRFSRYQSICKKGISELNDLFKTLHIGGGGGGLKHVQGKRVH